MRIRTVKPEFFQSETLYDLERESCLPVRTAFIGLWGCCDREGRFEWRPRKLKVNILPHDDVDFSRVLHALTTRGFVEKYATGTGVFGYIPGFKKHQVINNKERVSELPEFEEKYRIISELGTAETTREARVDDALSTRDIRKGREGKGKEPSIKTLLRSTSKSMDGFTEFYDRYPRKKSRADAERAWKNKRLANHLTEILGDLAQREAQDAGWNKENPFVPYPASYLNAKRWEDEDKTVGTPKQEKPREKTLADYEKAAQEARQAILDTMTPEELAEEERQAEAYRKVEEKWRREEEAKYG
jgi:hypothetical protein